MALGEWVSVTSARELAEREIRIESSELQEDPKGEGEELQLIYESKGRNWVTKPTRSGCPAGTNCVGV